jgi:Lon-like protease
MTEAPSLPTARPRRRRRIGVTLVVIVVVVLVLVGVASRITLNYYVISPGDAQEVTPLIKVPPGKAHPGHGTILLTDVLLGQVTLLSIIPDWLSSNNQIISSGQVLGDNIPASELSAQGYLQMSQAQTAAKTAGLRHLGYVVPEHDAGVVIAAVTSQGPAADTLAVAQVVTAVDGAPTANVCSFSEALSTKVPGEAVTLSVEQSTVTEHGQFVPGPVVPKVVRLVKRPAGLGGESACPGVPASKGYLGVAIETQQDFTFPFPIAIDTAQIGGPSAGLAMTLGVIDLLSSGDLTGGRTIAATGTIDADGNVGDVGGVPQKTIAVERAGASVFLVPPQELSAARSKATPGLRVYAVSTLDQALALIGKLGGHVPAPQS